MWIEPRTPRTMEGLVEGFLRAAAKGNGTRERDRERVMCAVFPGPLYVSGGLDVEGCESERCGSEGLETGSQIQIQGMELDLSDVVDYDDDGMGDWAAFDYDESRGRVVLASSYGRVLVLEV